MTLQVEALEVRHGARPVVADVSLRVGRGELVTVLGASGSGKTTLLRAVAGLHPTRSGRVLLDGVDVTGLPAERRRVGLVPQEGALFPHRSVAANVGYGVVRRERRQRVADMLDLVGLADRATAMPHELSGGQRQRVALARALAPSPPVLLLDEPFSGLDASLRADLRGETARILADAGTAAVLVTHDVAEALSLSTRVLALGDGRVLGHGTPHDLYERPTSRAVAELLGPAFLLAGRARGVRTVSTSIGTLTTSDGLVPGSELTVLLRPEHLAITHADPADDAHGTVAWREYRGDSSTVHVDVDVQKGGRLAVQVRPREPWAVGDRVRLHATRPVHTWPA